MKKEKKKEKFDRNILYSYLQERYEVTKFPKQFFIKLSNIFNGKLSDLAKPIPPEHLYDMWLQKETYLNKVYMDNIRKGKKMDGYVRANYDLAILLSKYDSYLKWLDRQKSEKVSNEKIEESVQVTEVIYSTNLPTKKEDDLSVFLDELI